MREAFQLWRLVRRLHRDTREAGACATLMVIVEKRPEDAPWSWTPRRGCEVNYFPDMSRPATARRGRTIGEALAKVLLDR